MNLHFRAGVEQARFANRGAYPGAHFARTGEALAVAFGKFDPEVFDGVAKRVEQLAFERPERAEPRDEHRPHMRERGARPGSPQLRGAAEPVNRVVAVPLREPALIAVEEFRRLLVAQAAATGLQ